MTLLHAISRSHGNDILQIFSLGPDQEKRNAIWMLSTATCNMLQLQLYMLLHHRNITLDIASPVCCSLLLGVYPFNNKIETKYTNYA